jgi:hypothetical protein
MATLPVEISDSDLAALTAEAERAGMTPGALLAALARARAEHARRIAPGVLAMIDRQITRHRSAFDRLAE